MSKRLEERYIVIKIKGSNAKDIRAIRQQIAILDVKTPECVVIESDWPEYEPVVDCICKRSGIK